MKYNLKKKLICEFVTYIYKKNNSAVQMLKCIGSFYWLYEYKSTVHVHVKV